MPGPIRTSTITSAGKSGPSRIASPAKYKIRHSRTGSLPPWEAGQRQAPGPHRNRPATLNDKLKAGGARKPNSALDAGQRRVSAGWEAQAEAAAFSWCAR
ncbi:hypothetical protein Smic_78100 [Streptomyces microflavus]|uniref:Uncharacterized protein n=1 Tax=Streptomyces microflavus TaxID=1919 RepID=A0A7J0D4Y2_STRMI|nr:hypothetical protein Smic_78100 [Streptomyces microflavus]